MNKKLKLVLLIDDDEATNFINKTLINQLNCAENVAVALNGKSALDYLKSKVSGSYPQPDLIFLDINMPGMNGWEFLDQYYLLEESQKGKVVVVMLTASDNPDDVQRAQSLSGIKGYRTKPLTFDMLKSILEENFQFTFST